jgi:hypothetical protein
VKHNGVYRQKKSAYDLTCFSRREQKRRGGIRNDAVKKRKMEGERTL